MKREVLYISAISAMVAVGSPAHAVTTNSVTVTATRIESDTHTVPFSVTSLDMKDEQTTRMPRTLPEAFSRVPSVMGQKTGHGQGSPFIRGFTGYRTLLMVDGIRVNNSTFRAGPNQYWATVDSYSLDSLEVVNGPGSVLYGSDALGGTVNARTLGISAGEISPRFFYRFSSAEDSHIGRAEVNGMLNDRLGLVLGATVKDFGDLEAGDEVGTQLNTGYDEHNWDAKLQYNIDNDQTLTFAHYGTVIDDAWRTHKTIYGIAWEGTTVGNEKARLLDQDRQLTYVRYDKQNVGEWVEDMNITVSMQRQEESQFRIKKDDSRDLQGFDVDTAGAAIQFHSPMVRSEWVYGIDYYRDEVDSFRHKLTSDNSYKSSSIQGPLGDDASYDTLGAYIQNDYPLTEKLSILTGLRYTYAAAKVDRMEDPESGNVISLDENWDNVVGSVRLRHFCADNSVMTFVGASQGFRAPSLSDLSRLDDARSNEIETPSPDLDPEKVLSYEAGIKSLHDRGSVQVAYYYTDLDNMITRTPTGRMIGDNFEVTKKNGGDGYIQGIELSGSYFPAPDWEVFGVATWQDGEAETYPTSDPVLVTEPVDRLMPLTANVGARWTHAGGRFWLEGEVAAADKQDDLSSRDKEDTQRIPPAGTPSYALVHVRGGMMVTDTVSLNVAVENIADEDYRIHGSGLNGAGRNLLISLNVPL
jgi:hemoglobin/transferrin/lactoferrin receptor protein